MESKELRIGNLTYYTVHDNMDERKSWNEVNTIDAEDLLAISKGAEGYSPIPLTEEWLLRMGFYKVNHIHGYSFYSTKAKRGEIDPHISIYERRTEVRGSSVNHCLFVHQVQNLYYCITGKELESFSDGE